MFRTLLVTTASILGIALLASNQSIAQTHQPYAGLQARPIKALSDRQLADLRAGRGMEMALAAELNGYPGPAHVIELAEQLKLTAVQRAEVTRLRDVMKAEAAALGERLIAQETALDRQFADRAVTKASLTDAIAEIARTLGELRAAHLQYHLTTRDILSPDQVKQYAQLRGYHGGQQEPGNKPHHHNVK